MNVFATEHHDVKKSSALETVTSKLLVIILLCELWSHHVETAQPNFQGWLV